jgi:hypothetical protein
MAADEDQRGAETTQPGPHRLQVIACCPEPDTIMA